MNFKIDYIRMISRILTHYADSGESDLRVNKRKWRRYDERLSNTQFFQVEPGPQISAKDILEIVYKALKEKGYNPVNQIVGYIMSGDPTYITSYNGARSLIMKVERDELVEELLKAYIEHNSWE